MCSFQIMRNQLEVFNEITSEDSSLEYSLRDRDIKFCLA